MLNVGGVLEVESIPEYSSKLSPNPKALGEPSVQEAIISSSQVSDEQGRLRVGGREQPQRRVENLEKEIGAFHFPHNLFPSLNSFLLAVQFIFHLFPEIQRH